MTTTAKTEVTEPESAASPVGKTAVGFDEADSKIRVIPEGELLEGSKEGDTITVDGRMLTILEFCDSIESARASCEQRVSGVSETLKGRGEIVGGGET